MARRPRILVLAGTYGPTFHLTARAPFTALAARGDCDARFHLARSASGLARLAWCDALFLVRPMSRYANAAARAARALGRHVIAYWDDDILDVPRRALGAPTRYESARLRRNVADVVQTAHVLAVANPRLAAALREHGLRLPPVVVLKVPALGVDLAPEPPERRRTGAPSILYAGSADHAGPVQDIAVPALQALRQQGVAFEFEVAGPQLALPGELAAVTHFHSRMPYEQWLAFRNERRWDVALAPLPDSAFHACKFHNKFLEYTAAGAPCVYSDVPPYSEAIAHGRTGLLAANAPAAWVEAIRRLLEDPGLGARLVREAWARLAADHNPSVVMESYRAELPGAFQVRPARPWSAFGAVVALGRGLR